MASKRSPVRPADELLVPVVAETLQALTLGPADSAAARLALRYAEHIDSAENPADALERLGPKLLSALVALGGTPSGRKGKAGGVTVVGSRLQAVRDRRAN